MVGSAQCGMKCPGPGDAMRFGVQELLHVLRESPSGVLWSGQPLPLPRVLVMSPFLLLDPSGR